MTPNQTNLKTLAEKLAYAMSKVEDDEPHVFSRGEVETLQSVIAFVEKLKALKWFGKWAMYFVVAGGTIIINWERIKEWWVH